MSPKASQSIDCVREPYGTEDAGPAQRAINNEDLLNLGGTYGDRASADPAECDPLRIVLTNDNVDIEVFDRRALLASSSSTAPPSLPRQSAGPSAGGGSSGSVMRRLPPPTS
jgi:hypothetical protein